MSATASAAELLATVERSPQAVAAHDRGAWVALFAGDALVADPVGARPHRGTAAIERFYDTFIAPNGIAFRVAHDVVCGMTVYRDLVIETTMSTGVTLRVPMHLRYDLVQAGDELRIRELRAHWELPVMVGQLLVAGVPGLLAAAKLAPQLLGNQGLGGALGFARGFVRVGAGGRRAATALLAAASRGDGSAFRAALALDATLTWCGTPVGIEGFLAHATALRVEKPITAGRFVTATVHTRTARGIAELEIGRGNHVAAARIYVR
ncbi:nuclear transport factor 2 family protein [Nocardia blacklockiae]|uniref:nuclear transport factor 2 family protein n=1 Tax=Nocardia blacklockiae TaxID=480036 RepID=UPI001893ED47|nr:nuclear transport factor 2 family protein [Nocardia blacklockiae]MBF6175613.1 nuclear transport factor 2 family protein [Nocardia blacklockiae]